MTSHSQRFGLSRFGGNAGGSITDEGSKFSLHDPQVMDSLLAALEHHDHSGTGVPLINPTTGPLCSVGGAGALPGGTRVYFRTSFLDQYGLESAASPEVTVTTPSPLRAPSTPALAATGTLGGLAVGGGYLYALSTVVVTDAQNPNGSVLGQTEVSAPGSISILPGQTAVATLPALPAVVTSITNQVINPGAEVDLTHWTATAGVTLTRETIGSVVGAHSFGLTHTGAGASGQGVGHDTFTVPANTLCTFSLYVEQVSGSSSLELYASTASQTVASSCVPGSTFSRYSVQVTTGASETTVTCGLRFVGAGSSDKVLYDAAQFEQGGLTPYADGSLGIGYAWTGTPGLSTSTRASGVGTVGFYVYRQAPGEQGLYLLTSAGVPLFVTSSSFVDAGAYSPDPTKLAPFSNSTSATSSVLAAVQGLPATAVAWRLYRSFASGSYPTQSLVHQVSEGSPGTTNYVINPEAAVDLTGWTQTDTVAGATLTRETTAAPPVGAGADGYFTRAAGARTVSKVSVPVRDGKVLAGQSYALSVYLEWDGTGTNPAVSLFLGATNGTGGVNGTSPAYAMNAGFTRITQVFVASNDLAVSSVASLVLDNASTATGVRITGWQLEDNISTAYTATTRLPVLAQSWLDTGASLLDGVPLVQSECFGAPQPIRLPVYTTAGRPAAYQVGKGGAIYDDTLHKPVWSDGTAFRDGAGTVV